MCLSDILQLVSTVFYVISIGALIITLCVLIWYACETRALRKETVKQTELSQRPCVVLDYEPGRISYKNIGNSPAFNLKVEPLELKDVNDKTVFILHFNPIYLLEPSALAEVKWSVEFINKDIEKIFKGFNIEVDFPFFIGVLPATEFGQITDYEPMIIHYKNLENAPYQTKIQPKVKEQEIEITSTGKTKKYPS